MTTKAKSYQIFLNSKDADIFYNASYNSNVRFYLDSMINIDADEEILKVSLSHFQSPITWYNIYSNNNTIKINNISKTLTEGRYNIDELLTELNSEFTNYTFAYNEITNKCSITTDNKYIEINSQNQNLSINNNSMTITSGEYTWDMIVAILNAHYTDLTFSIVNDNLSITALNGNDFYYYENNISYIFNGNSYSVLNTYNHTDIVNYISVQNLSSQGGNYNLSGFEWRENVDRYAFKVPDSMIDGVFDFSGVAFFGFTDGNYTIEDTGLGYSYFTAQDLPIAYNIISPLFQNDYGIESIFRRIPVLNTEPGSSTEQVLLTLYNYQYVEGSLLDYLGFSSLTNQTSLILTSPYVVDLSGYSHLIVRTNFNTKNISSKNKKRGNILAHIPIESVSYIVYQNNTGFGQYVDDKNVSFIDIQVQNPDNEYIDFKNRYFNLVLEIHVEKI